ncbi:hypothetical protein BDV36DRAFT_268911 [Aspergillus pseudocaelatus]|uniref:Haloacid dehalogenase-like hydrolase n=1 Tax=Aspergillus pseudocaelatus TaxID=1825620 RepID=A0ABQ6WB08_9EURO|nr:hypothetical protein BDV36DRAFT_268911 [Aspergillus pseudocaelatus]
MTPKPRTLLLTLDAFETLFHPRPSVPEQYASAAHHFGLPKTAITAERVFAAFKPAFKAQSKARPNYGRDDVIRGHYGGPRQWWGEIIRATFVQVLAEQHQQYNNNTTATTNNKNNNDSSPGQVDLPEGLVGYLLDRFASKEGYALYDDVGPFFSRIRAVKENGARLGPFERVVIGVVSNSDDRVPAVLKSLGLRVGDCRADEGVDSMWLSGFEERSSSGVVEGSAVNDGVNDIDLVVTSYEAGVEKPSPRIFEVARRQAKALARGDNLGDWTCVHVGDDLEKDYRAAVGAGWHGYFLARGDDAARSGHGDTNVIRSLVDLVPLLEAYP